MKNIFTCTVGGIFGRLRQPPTVLILTILGQVCWRILQKSSTETCQNFCNISKFSLAIGRARSWAFAACGTWGPWSNCCNIISGIWLGSRARRAGNWSLIRCQLSLFRHLRGRISWLGILWLYRRFTWRRLARFRLKYWKFVGRASSIRQKILNKHCYLRWYQADLDSIAPVGQSNHILNGATNLKAKVEIWILVQEK